MNDRPNLFLLLSWISCGIVIQKINLDKPWISSIFMIEVKSLYIPLKNVFRMIFRGGFIFKAERLALCC